MRAPKTLISIVTVFLTLLIVAACSTPATPAPAAQPAQPTTAPAPQVAPTQAPAQPAAGGEQMVDTTKYKKAAPYTICFSNASISNSWRVSFVEHIRYAVDEAKKAGLVKNYIETDANDDPTKQVADTEDLLTKGCDVLIVSPATSEAMTPVVEKAMDKGVPVVTVDRNISSDKYVSFVECSSCTMATKQAEWLVQQLGGKGNIVMLAGLAGASPAETRLQCASEVFAKYPDIKILDKQYTGWSPVEGKRIMENLLLKYPQIDALWADSGLQGSGAAEAFLDAKMTVPPITGEDFNRFLKMWKEKDLNAIAVDYTVRQGYEAMQVALKILKGESVPHHVVVPNTVITQENLDQYVRLDLPDDYWAGSMPEVAERLLKK